MPWVEHQPYVKSGSCPFCGRDVSVDMCQTVDGHRCVYCRQRFFVYHRRYGMVALSKSDRWLRTVPQRWIDITIASIGIAAAAYGVWTWVLPLLE